MLVRTFLSRALQLLFTFFTSKLVPSSYHEMLGMTETHIACFLWMIPEAVKAANISFSLLIILPVCSANILNQSLVLLIDGPLPSPSWLFFVFYTAGQLFYRRIHSSRVMADTLGGECSKTLNIDVRLHQINS